MIGRLGRPSRQISDHRCADIASGRYCVEFAVPKHRVEGNPDPKNVSTSFAERQNLTLRMQQRRFTRLANAFSKKLENHALSVALNYMHYNFCRIHKTLLITPAIGMRWVLLSFINMLGLLAGQFVRTDCSNAR